MRYRTGRHNPHTLYVRDKGVVMREPGERPIGFISDEAMAMLAAEAMTASACPACPLACGSCSRNRATCECYEHQDAPESAKRRCANCGDAIHSSEVQAVMDGCECLLCGTCIDVDHACPQSEGSTPIESPAAAGELDKFLADRRSSGLHDPDLHAFELGDDTTEDGSPACAHCSQRRDAHGAPSGEEPRPADDPSPVPPPVDAPEGVFAHVLAAVVDFADRREIGGAGSDPYRSSADDAHEIVVAELEVLWAAGVAEGRAATRSLAADGPADPMDELTRRLLIYGSVMEDLGESGYNKHEPADVKGVADAVLDFAQRSIADAYARGVTEGHRQATSEAIIKATVQTLRTASMWVGDKDQNMFTDSADDLERNGADEACCPVCEEVECDAGCPLETLRAAPGEPRG